MPSVLGVVGARLNSNRLPGKQLLDLAGKPVIERIFERLEQVPELNSLTLATTDDDYNRPLVEWARARGKAVFAFAGDVNDLVGRVDTLVRRDDPEVVVYFCGDSPLVEPQTVSRLIRAAQRPPNADLVELAPPASGGKYIHEGFSVYRRSTWDRIVAEACTPDEREHVGSSLKRLAGSLSTEWVTEDAVYASVHHRISVDTPSDYRFMAEIYRRWYAANAPNTIVSLRWVLEELTRDPVLAAISADVRQKAAGESSIRVLLVCQAGTGVGLGHLARTLALARALQDRACAGVTLLIQGEPVRRKDLELLPQRYIASDADLAAAVGEQAAVQRAQVAVFDLDPQRVPAGFELLLSRLRQANVRRVAVDDLFEYGESLDFIHVPSFHLAPAKAAGCGCPVYHGWDSFLLAKPEQARRPVAGNRLLVLTGGSDAKRLGRTLPSEIDSALPVNTAVHWVRGPYADMPMLPTRPRLQWTLHQSPESLDGVMAQADYGLTVYGVSLFELLQRGIPTVVFSPYGDKDRVELDCLRHEQVALVAQDPPSAVKMTHQLMTDALQADALGQRARAKLDGNGAARLAERIRALVARSCQEPSSVSSR